MEDIFEFGMKSVLTKWRAIGWPLEEMPGVFPVDYSLEHSELAKRQIRLLEAKIIGEPHPDPDSDPEVQGLFFDLVARSANTTTANGKPFTIQWRFEDADPWHVVIDNGSTRAEHGVASNPDLTWDTSWAKWIGLSKGSVDPKRADAEARSPLPRLAPRPLPLHEDVPAQAHPDGLARAA